MKLPVRDLQLGGGLVVLVYRSQRHQQWRWHKGGGADWWGGGPLSINRFKFRWNRAGRWCRDMGI